MSLSPPIYPNSEYSFISPRRQYFSLPFGLISYLTECPQSNPIGFQKLQQTCKHFISKKRILVLDSAVYSASDHFYYKSKQGNRTQARLYANRKYWLANMFTINTNLPLACLNCMYRCTLKKLEIVQRDLISKDFYFLIDGGKIASLILSDVNIKNEEDETPLTIDLILSKCPKIKEIQYWNKCEIFSTKTFQKLNQIKFQGKFQLYLLVISQIENELDPLILCDFLLDHADPFAFPWIRFDCDISNSDLNVFRRIVQNALGNQFANLSSNRMMFKSTTSHPKGNFNRFL